MRRVSTFRYVRKDALHVLMNDVFYWTISVVIVVALSGIFHDAHAQINIGSVLPKVQISDGAEWHYYKGLQKPALDWNRPDLDAGNWQTGPTGIGYGSSTSRTHLGDMQGNYSTVYARTEFWIDNPATAAGMTLSVVCDGPFMAYLNGIEMIRTNTVQMSTPDQPIGAAEVEQFNISGFIHELNPGKNVLAIQCDNDDINSEDFSFIPVFEVSEKRGGQ